MNRDNGGSINKEDAANTKFIDYLQRFKYRLEEDVEMFKINNIDHNVSHHVEILVESINRAISELENVLSPEELKKRKHSELRKFINIFCHKYHELMGKQFILKITPVHCKVIGDILKQFSEEQIIIEDYLNYLFDEFYPHNSKFMPPNIGFVISGFAITKFRHDKSNEIQKRKEAIIQSVEMTDVMNRYRILLKQIKENSKIKSWMTEYKQHEMTLSEFKEKIITEEEKLKQNPINLNGNVVEFITNTEAAQQSI